MDYAEAQRQHWNSASGHAWVASQILARLFEALPIGSPIWQPRGVPISCSTLAAGRDLEADVADADRGVPRFLEREWPAVDGAAGQHRVGQEAP